MIEILDNIKGLIEQDELYLIFVNGEIVAKRTNQVITISDQKTSNEVSIDYQDAKKYNYLFINEDAKVKIFHIINEDGLFTQQVEINKNVNVEVYEYLFITTNVHFSTSLVAKNNSTLNYLHVKEGQNNSPLDYKIYSHVFKDAKINLHNLNAIKSTSTEYINGTMLAEGSEYKVYTVDMNNSESKHLLDVVAQHQVGNSMSRFACFGLVNNGSNSVINTNGIIKKYASNSDMDHNIKGIILDSKSTIITNPILEIDEYDVVAGHGASVGDVSQEEIYYLMSRGLTYEQSKKLILMSLVTPILDGFEDELFNNFVLGIINNNI